MSGHHDPRLLYSVQGIRAYHLQNGEESELTPSGPQTLSLLMVPTTSPFADRSSMANQPPEEDFYLHLNLPPELDLPLPATTQIYHQPPSSYLIPRWDMGPDSGAFTRIEFPQIDSGVSQEDVDTFETILAQCTAFLERTPAPPKGTKAYNPQDYKPGEGYVPGTGSGQHGQIVLVDEENGSVVGQLADSDMIVEDSKLKPGEKDPVEITVSPDGKRIDVTPLSDDYLGLSRHPAYRNSSIVQNAAAVSRLLVTSSGYVGNLMTSSAENFQTKTKPVSKPLTFQPATHDRVRKINAMTQGAASFSSRTVGQATKFAQNIGAAVARRGDKDGKEKKLDKEGYKPGILNKSMIAFSTIADGVAYGGKHLLNTGGAAATAVVGHRYGEDARKITAELAGGVKNVGLVYIDVTGVTRRAVIKSVAKGMVVGRVNGGGEVIVGGEDGGVVPSGTTPNISPSPSPAPGKMMGGASGSQSGSMSSASGNVPPPSYSSSMGATYYAQNLPEKGGYQ